MASSVTRHTFDDVMMPNHAPHSMIPVRGQGARVWDQHNKEYIDFSGGGGCAALGHNQPDLQQTLIDQSQQLCQLSPDWINEPALHLASALCQLSFAERVCLTGSAAEANEIALKLARKYARDQYNAHKQEIITFSGSHHGHTLFNLAVSGQPAHRHHFGPLPGGVTHLPFNDLASLEYQISDTTCAVIMALIQTNKGVISAEPAFVKGARELCNKYNTALIFDETETGMGRTGSLFAYLNYDIIPDILTTANGLGSLPIGAVLTQHRLAECFTPGSHNSPGDNHPLTCAVADKALQLISDTTLLASVRQKHSLLLDGLHQLNKKIGLFQEIRGEGLLIGCQLKSLWRDKARPLQQVAQEQGVLVSTSGDDVLRLTPPLNIAYPDINQGLKRLAQAMLAVKMGF